MVACRRKATSSRPHCARGCRPGHRQRPTAVTSRDHSAVLRGTGNSSTHSERIRRRRRRRTAGVRAAGGDDRRRQDFHGATDVHGRTAFHVTTAAAASAATVCQQLGVPTSLQRHQLQYVLTAYSLMEHTKIHGRQSKFILRVANDRPRGRRKAPNRRMEGSGKGTALPL